MASNYSVYGAKFNPFTYEELVTPVMQMTKDYRDMQDKYSALMAQAEAWQDKANEENNPYAHAIYTNYINDLKLAADDLSRTGLNEANRSKLLSFYPRYAKEIMPIENAYTKWNQVMEEHRKMQMQDPTFRASYGDTPPNIDMYLANPELQFNTTSGNTMRKEVSDRAKNFALHNPTVWREILDGRLLQGIQSGLYSVDDIYDIINGDEEARKENPELVNLVDTVVNEYMQGEWSDEDKEWGWKYAAQGLYDALTDREYNYYNNPGYTPGVPEEESESQLPMLESTYFKNIPRAKVEGYKSEELENMIKVINEYRSYENPLELYRQKMIDYKGNPSNYHTGDIGGTWRFDKAKKERERYKQMSELELKKDFIKTYKDMLKKAKIKLEEDDVTEDMSMDDIVDIIEGFIKSNAVMSYDYVLNMPKPDLFANFIINANLGVDKDNKRRQRSAYIRYANAGNLNGQGVKHRNRTEYIPKDGEHVSFSFSPLEGEFIYTIRDDEGNYRRFYVSPELFGNQLLTTTMDTYKEILESGAYDEASRWITGYTDEKGVSHQGILAMFQRLVNDHLKAKSATGDSEPEYIVDMTYLLGQQ